jgi:uncharacterized RDD family membrane protein YckC
VFRVRYTGRALPVCQAPAVTEPYGEPAGAGRRLAAFFIDGVASDLVALLFTRPPSPAYSGAVLGIFVLERIVLTALTGASFGQRCVGIVVVRLDGRPVGFGAAAIRTVLLALLVPIFFVDREGRGLHDRAAGTAEVLRPPRR